MKDVCLSFIHFKTTLNLLKILTTLWRNVVVWCVLFSFVFHADVFEKALNAGFIQATDYVEIWQAYLDYLRRRVDFSKGESVFVSWTFCMSKKTQNTTQIIYLMMCYLVFFFFFAESSKELEELRAAFSRSLDYMKHDVEERKQTAPTSIFAVFLSWFSFHIIHLPLSL